MRMTPRPERPVTGGAALALLLAATLVGACDGTQTVDGVLAPSALSATGGTAAGQAGGVTVVRGTAELVGSWTRVTGTGVLLTEQTFTFFPDGSGARATVTRTALGAELSVEQATFTWSAGGGILSLRFLRDGAADTLVRASYAVLADVGATVLRLDGAEYVRIGR